MKKNIFLFSMLAVLLLTACKTTRSVAKVELASANSFEQVIALVERAEPQFNTANVSKMSLALNLNERKINVSATCKIRKDSAIHLSIQPFMGIELFKAELLPDSMWVFDKMNRRYYVVDYAFFKDRFGVEIDYYSLQALISNQFFCVGKKDVSSKGSSFSILTDGRKKINFETARMQQSTEVSAVNVIQSVLLKAKDNNYQLQTNYAEFSVMDGVNFPQKIALHATNEKTEASCDFSILKVSFNKDIKFSNTNPDRYTRGDINQLLNK